jgi:hypothetical protein
MPENDDLDPAANTQMFQAFVDRGEQEDARPGWMRPAIAVAALAVLVIVVVVAWLALG